MRPEVKARLSADLERLNRWQSAQPTAPAHQDDEEHDEQPRDRS